MSNDYFNHSANVIPPASVARSAQVNNIATEIAAGFDKLPSQEEITRGTTTAVDDTGVANAYVVAFTAPLVPTTYVDKMQVRIRIKSGNTNTGASTINVNGLGVKSIKQRDGSALPANALLAGLSYDLEYNSAAGEFRLMTPVRTIIDGSGNEIVVGG